MSIAISLPTLDRLGASIDPSSIDAQAIVSEWFSTFANLIAANDVPAIAGLFLEDATWRDMLALTWTLRTFIGPDRIATFLNDRLALSKLTNLALMTNELKPGLQQPYPDIVWIQSGFTFETEIGTGSGVFRLVPGKAAGKWHAHAVFTNLEGLKGHPELLGPLRNPLPNHGLWTSARERDVEFVDREPKVVIIGGGQSGLEVAARLKYLGVHTLVVEKNKRIGDNWRGRYQALCLHDPVWYDHMPYLPFPPTWPVYTPAAKLADWLESYAHSLELDVWTSSKVTSLTQDPITKKWTVHIDRGTKGTRTFTVEHIVVALGLGSVRMPTFPGQDQFKGVIQHSSRHGTALDFKNKKVIVVGACTSGHDIAADFAHNGVDVTLFQRGKTYIMTNKEGMPRLMGALYWEGSLPTDLADRVNASFPNLALKQLHKRITADIAAADKEILDGLKRVGFRTFLGDDDSGFLMMAWEKAGGYYLDVGTSQMIIDGKIKLKSDSQIASFTPTGLKFENGSELEADAVIFATGYSDIREALTPLIGAEQVGKLNRVWGLNEEGELNSVWRASGLDGLYWMLGNLALCRFHSKHLALQIKAKEVGLFGSVYNS